MKQSNTHTDGLFRRLRFRFLRINFIAILLVLIVVLFCVYAATILRTQRQNTQYMQNVIEKTIKGEEPLRKNNGFSPINEYPKNFRIASASGLNLNTDNPSADNTKKNIPRRTNNNRPGLILLQTDTIGTVIEVHSDDQRFTEDDFQNIAHIALSSTKKRFSYNNISYQKQIVHAEDDTIYIAVLDDRGEQDTTTTLLRVSLLAGLGSFIVAFALSTYLSNKAIKPIAESWERQQAFIADAAHELKTPLAVIRSNVEAIETEPDSSVQSQQKWLNYIKEETKDMTSLVEELLFLAATDSQIRQAKQECINLSTICDESFTQFETLLFEASLHIESNIEENIFIEAEPEKIRQLLRILLDNMVKYTKSNGQGMIQLKSNGRKVLLSISNECENPPQNVDTLFARFYQERKDHSRARTDGEKGYGLGLSIAEAIVTQSQGHIWASRTDTEIAFFISWPKVRSTKSQK